MSDSVILEAWLSDSATIFKHIIDLLSHGAPIKKSDSSSKSIKQAFFKITKKGIYISLDYKNDILINANLEGFSKYTFNYPKEDLHIAVGIDNLKNLLKNVKRNVGIMFSIFKKADQEVPSEMSISLNSTIYPQSTTLITVNFNIIQNIKINATVDGQELTEISSGQFTDICKLMTGSKSKIKVIVDTSSENKESDLSSQKLLFTREEYNIATASMVFDLKMEKGFSIDFVNYYKSEYFKTIAKLSVFAKVIKIYSVDDSIVFKSSILESTKSNKSIGSISIWIKPEEPPQKEISSDDDDI